MPKKYSIVDCAKEVLDLEKRPLAPPEIWDIGVRRELVRKIGTKSKDPHNRTKRIQLLRSRLLNGVDGICRAEGRPAKFYTGISEAEDEMGDSSAQRNDVSRRDERDIHPLLAYAANRLLLGGDKKIWTKTIMHEKSEKKGKRSEWLHPDMVGVYMPPWHDDVAHLGQQIAGSDTLVFYSFEIKREINGSNYRECFFQAVSNSSWANEGYLVAINIAETASDLMLNLERLCSEFGIGIIQLFEDDGMSDNPVVYPAKRKKGLGWETINRIASINPDFGEFVKCVNQDFKSRRIREGSYEKILPDIEDYIAKKKLTVQR